MKAFMALAASVLFAVIGMVTTASATEASNDLETALQATSCADPAHCDYFSELERMYKEEGSLPSQDEMTGWFAGRCYSVTNKTYATNGLLAGYTEFVGGDNGPAFPGTNVFKLGAYVYDGRSADYFDNMTPSLQTEIERVIKSGSPSISAVTVKDGALASGTGTTLWQFRKVGSYFVMKRTDNDTTVQNYCYYFKRVK